MVARFDPTVVCHWHCGPTDVALERLGPRLLPLRDRPGFVVGSKAPVSERPGRPQQGQQPVRRPSRVPFSSTSNSTFARLQAGARSVSLSPKEATIRAAIASRCAAKTQIASGFLELGQRQPSIWDTGHETARHPLSAVLSHVGHSRKRIGTLDSGGGGQNERGRQLKRPLSHLSVGDT